MQIDDAERMKGADLLAQLKQQVGDMKRPLLLAALKKANSADTYWQEEWRGFVVPDQWPDKKSI